LAGGPEEGVLQAVVAGGQFGDGRLGQQPQQVTRPADALRIEAVDRLEQEDLRVAEQSHSDAEPPAHAERVRTGAPLHRVGQTDDAQHSLDPGVGDVVARGQCGQVCTGAAAGMERRGIQERADRLQRPAQVGYRTP
jgi:hypothetical protein